MTMTTMTFRTVRRILGLVIAIGAHEACATVPNVVQQEGHPTDLVTVVITRDSRNVVSLALEGEVVLWDLSSTRVIRRISTFLGANVLAASPTGKTAAVCNEDFIGLWDLTTGRRQWRVAAASAAERNGESAGCLDLAFTPDGMSIVMAGSWSGRLLSASDGRELRFFDGRKLPAGRRRVFQHVALSPDGRVAFTGGTDGAALWSIADAEVTRKIDYSGSRSVAFSHDGRLVAAGTLGRAAVWDVESGVELREFDKKIGWVTEVRFAEDNKALLAACAIEGLAWVWDLATKAEVRQFEAHGVPVIGRTPTFSYDGRLVIGQPVTVDDESPFRLLQPRTATAESFRVWEARTGRQVSLLRSTREPITASTLAPNGRFAALAVGRSVTVFDLEAGGQLPDVLSHAATVDFMTFDDDGGRLLTNSGDDILTLWDVKTGTGRQLIRPALPRTTSGIQDVPKNESSVNGAFFPRSTKGAVFTPNGESLVTREERFLRTWNLRDDTQRQRLALSWESSVLVMLRDGTLLMNDGLKLYAFRPSESEPKLVREFTSGDGLAALSGDGRFAAISDWQSGATHLVEVSTGRRIWRMRTNGPAVVGLFSPDNRFLILGTPDQHVSLWNVSSRRLVRAFPDRWNYDHVAFSGPKGLLLAGGGDTGIAQLFDAATGRELVNLGVRGQRSWLMTTPRGHFDASDLDELSGMSWVFSDDPLTPLGPEVFLRDYFEPRLLARVLAGERMPSVRDLSAVSRAQPCVDLDVRWDNEADGRALVTVRLDRNRRQVGDGCQPGETPTNVYAVRVQRDGQLVASEPKIVVQSTGTAGNDELRNWRTANRVGLDASGRRALVYQVQVPRRADLRTIAFSAYAFNEDRVKSASVGATLDRTVDAPSSPGTAYIVSVGVNKTQDSPTWDLRFAAADARLMSDVLVNALKRTEQFSRVIMVPLVSDANVLPGEASATKYHLKAVLDLLAGRPVEERLRRQIPAAAYLRKVQPEDLVLLSFSSHGFTDAGGSFHIVLEDTVTNRNRTLGMGSVVNSLSSDELSVWLSDIDAGEMVMVIDACHSEASVNEQAFKPAPIGSRGLGQLAYEKGMRILAASQTAQTAAERPGAIRQGLLTYALLRDGLEQGRADFQQKDGRITLREWLEYGARRVPDLFAEGPSGSDSVNRTAFRAFYVGGKKVVVRHQRPVYFDFSRHRGDPTIMLMR